MTTLKSSVRIAGQVISNNDPQMVITLDAHPSVQIASIQDDSITYEFKGGVTQEALYNLNLTFTYQGRYEVKVPCTFKHTVVQVDYEVRPADLHVKAWESGNALPFQVWHDGVDITSQLESVTRGTATEILDYSYAPDTPAAMSKYWWLCQVAVGPEKTVPVEYTFKLPASIDPAQIVRNASGNFVIAAYDGTEMAAKYVGETPFLAATGSSKIMEFEVFYRGHAKPANSLSFLKDSSDIGTFTNTATGTSPEGRFQIQLKAGSSPVTKDLKIVIGTSLTNQVEGKNIVTNTVASKIYQPGLALLKVPSVVMGPTNSEHVKDVEFELDGVHVDADKITFSMNTDDLEVISKSTNNITYKLKRENNTQNNINYAVGVSFSYSGKTGTYAQQCTVTPSVNYIIETTPLTLKLWETKPLVFTITNNGVDISGPISNITMTDSPEVSSKYELVKLSGSSWGIKAISSSTTTQLTANAQLNFTFMDGGTEHVMSQTVSLTTEINNGEIPTNRFNVEFL